MLLDYTKPSQIQLRKRTALRRIHQIGEVFESQYFWNASSKQINSLDEYYRKTQKLAIEMYKVLNGLSYGSFKDVFNNQ